MSVPHTAAARLFHQAYKDRAEYTRIGWCKFCGKSRPSQLHKCRTCDERMGAYRAMQKRAIGYVSAAVMVGKIPPAKTLVCADCGAPAAHYDHRDYSRPADVQPVCVRCNNKRGPAKQLAEVMNIPSHQAQPSSPETPPTG